MTMEEMLGYCHGPPFRPSLNRSISGFKSRFLRGHWKLGHDMKIKRSVPRDL